MNAFKNYQALYELDQILSDKMHLDIIYLIWNIFDFMETGPVIKTPTLSYITIL